MACAATDATSGAGPSRRDAPNGAFGQFLAGRFAMAEADPNTAATALSRALTLAPNEPDLALQAFLANLAAERPDTLGLAARLPDNQIAQLVLADEDMRNARWAAAERRYHALPRQGLTQLLQPLLVAWSQQGAGHPDEALATLRPFADNPRFRGIFALHAGMIADLANRPNDAARLYQIVQGDAAESNLRLTQRLASWHARNDRPAEARRLLASMAERVPEIGISLRDLLAT